MSCLRISCRIKMNTLSRINKNKLLCSLSALKTLYQNKTSIVSHRWALGVKQRSLLSFVTATTSKPLAAKMSSGEPNIKIVNFDDVKKLKDDEGKLLIDVREPSELQETGVLPGSINIPLSEVENTLKNTSDDDFMDRYGRTKPDLSFPLVFSCRSGLRSKMAAQTAAKLGFEDVSSYSGGWVDWEENTKQQS